MADNKQDPVIEQETEETVEDEEKEENNEDKEPIQNPKQEENAERTYTQAEVDKIKSEVAFSARKKAKKEDAEVTKLQSQIADLQKFKNETENVLQEYEVLKAEKADREMRQKVADETNVDLETISMLGGDTEEELRANVEKHKAKFGVPYVPYGQNSHGKPEVNSLREDASAFVDKLFAARKE